MVEFVPSRDERDANLGEVSLSMCRLDRTTGEFRQNVVKFCAVIGDARADNHELDVHTDSAAVTIVWNRESIAQAQPLKCLDPALEPRVDGAFGVIARNGSAGYRCFSTTANP
jgi:hypothetical protein